MSDGALAHLAATPVLLVATDFDGTLAPIVDVPDAARATPRAVRALATLSRLPLTRAAVISGRGLTDLEKRLSTPLAEGTILIGSHGSEFEPERVGRLKRSERRLREAIRTAMDAAAEGLPGVTIEHKDVSSCLHYRQAERDSAARAVWRLHEARRGLPAPGPIVRRGKKVVEWLALPADKGAALVQLRADLGATGVLFMGDDRTDEDAFRALGPDDIGVKVGGGTTLATLRVDGVPEAADLLARMADMRARALREVAAAPIADMGFLSDRRTGALVTPRGEVCWLCPGRFDEPAVFASLLGGATAGRFVVRPAGEPTSGHQRYLTDSLVLETRWPSLTLTDYLDPPSGDAGTVLVREITPRGDCPARCFIEFAPRHDYGRAETVLESDRGKVEVRSGLERMTLEAPGVDFEVTRVGRAQVARAWIDVEAPLRLVLRTNGARRTPRPSSAVAADWRSWCARLDLPERWRDEVRLAALTLRGLFHGDHGAMVAALTTSLPEAIGGERNWDYRFTWLRDTALACDALVRLGSLQEARQFLDWLADRVGERDAPSLRPLYAVGGEPPLAEAELTHLLGYRASRPVRIGNAAARQLQIDVFGAVVELVSVYRHFGGEVRPVHWRLVQEMVGAVSVRWKEPDAGIWELRHDLRHHVHSKVMCWVAADSALGLAERLREPAPDEWVALRDAIRDEVLTRGWNADAGAFTTAYGESDLDAASLVVVLSGMLGPDDPRAVATVEAIQRELSTGNTVYRYRFDDGLRGREGGFHFCASLLVEALALISRTEDAEALFTHVLGAAGSTGMLSEQIDPETGAALGNVPQAYSHTGVIWNALALSDDPRARSRTPTGM